jgi:protein SCO1
VSVSLAIRVSLVCALLASGACRRNVLTLPRFGAVPAFALRDQDGHELGRHNLLGQVWIANFMFTSCPDICPLLTSKLASVRSRLVADRAFVRYVSFSVDPVHDSPEVLKNYAVEHGADRPDWSFVTGPADPVKDVIIHGFKQALSETPKTAGRSANTILHGSHFVLVDRGATIRGFYPSDDEGLQRLVRDARILLAEPAERKGT